MHRAIIKTVTGVDTQHNNMEDFTHAKISMSANGIPEKVDMPEAETQLPGTSMVYAPADVSFLEAKMDLASPLVFAVSLEISNCW